MSAWVSDTELVRWPAAAAPAADAQQYSFLGVDNKASGLQQHRWKSVISIRTARKASRATPHYQMSTPFALLPLTLNKEVVMVEFKISTQCQFGLEVAKIR